MADEQQATTHSNPWGRWQNIAQKAHWGDPGLYAVYFHDGYSDSHDPRSGQSQLDPWFQIYRYNFQDNSWQYISSFTSGVEITKFPDWRYVQSRHPLPNIEWKKGPGEYPGGEFTNGLVSLGDGRLWTSSQYLVNYNATSVPTTWKWRYIGWTSFDDGQTWQLKESYPPPPGNVVHRPDVAPGAYYNLDDSSHHFNWHHPVYIGDNTVMYHRTYPMETDQEGGITGAAMWGHTEYQCVFKDLSNYELDAYQSTGKDDLEDTNWKTYTNTGGAQWIRNAWHLSKICYLGKTGDIDYTDDNGVIHYKKSMLAVCFNFHVLRRVSDYYYLENCQRGVWRTDDGGYRWKYLGPILNDNCSWDDVQTENNSTYQRAYHQLTYLGGERVLGLFTVLVSRGAVSPNHNEWGVRAFISEDRGQTWKPKGFLPPSPRLYAYFHDEFEGYGDATWVYPYMTPLDVQYVGRIKKYRTEEAAEAEDTVNYVEEQIVIAEVHFHLPSRDKELGWTNREYYISRDGGETWELWADKNGNRMPILRESALRYNGLFDLPIARYADGSSLETYWNRSLEHFGDLTIYQIWTNNGFVGYPEVVRPSYNNGAIPSINAEQNDQGEVWLNGLNLRRPAKNDKEEEIKYIETIVADPSENT